MERVQFQQEQMLDELKDLVEKNLFTEKETKQIVKKRTGFETALVRRVAKKSDFLRYATYEMGLEQLRRKRVERTKLEPGLPSISDYALVRRQFHIFERAIKKFKSDVGLWIQYIQVAKREGARALVGRITARALQLHPNKPALYILAASHELDHQSSSSARTLLQRGIRLNPESVDLWREYVKMELGFIESLRRRWDILEINAGDEKKGARARDDPSHHIMRGLDEIDEAAQESMEVDDEVEGADSRKEIMQGAIVKSVITSAVQALPKMELFEALHGALVEYPSEPTLRQAVLEHLYDLLRHTLRDDAGAIRLLAGRFLKGDLKGEALVEGLRCANEEMLQRAQDGSREEVLQAYASFVEEWCGASIDANLKEYLVSSLRSQIQHKHARASPALLSAHIRLMVQSLNGDAAGPAKVLQMARRYTDKAPRSASVWLERLNAEKEFGGDVDKAWAEARQAVEGSMDEVEKVWTWGLAGKDSAEERLRVHEGLLKESMRDGSLTGVHETLLMRYVRVMHEVPGTGFESDQEGDSAKWLHSIRHMASAYLTTGAVWQEVFSIFEEEGFEVLREVYERWSGLDEKGAGLAWAQWLNKQGRGVEAAAVIRTVGRRMGDGELAELETEWGRLERVNHSEFLSFLLSLVVVVPVAVVSVVESFPLPLDHHHCTARRRRDVVPLPLATACIVLARPDSQQVSSEPRRLHVESRAYAHVAVSRPAAAAFALIVSQECPTSLTNKRIQKDSFSRSAFAGFHPPPALPLSISTNLPPSPASSPVPTSAVLPRSNKSSAPVPFPASHASAPTKSDKSSIASSTVEDVLVPGDFVGEGGTLQGETIRLVSLGAHSESPDYQEPAKEFQVKRRLGHGSYAVVYLVQEVLYRPQPSEDGHMSTIGMMEFDNKPAPPSETVYGREYAIKCLSKANLDEEDLAAQMSEVTIHQSLHSHPNIVTLHRTLETSSFLLLLLEYVPGEDLFYFLEQARDHYDSDPPNTADSSVSRTPPTPSLLSNMHPSQLLSRTRLRLIASMFAQMCDAVAACHAQSVFHRDIKPENFIVTDGFTTSPSGRQERKVIVKLTDFGLSTSDLASSDMDCGSAPYMSYECRNNVAPTYRPRAADVWSLGIVLINMLYHCNPWTDTAQGTCSSFDLYRRDPVNFFMYRFAGMTRPVAEFLANKVFCILEDPEDDSPRCTASEFGAWARNLPTLLGSHSVHRTVSSSSQGHPIASSTPMSHRPSSRHPSGSTSAGRTPAMQTRSLSRAPSLGPAYEGREISDLSTVFDHEPEPEEPEQEAREHHDLDLDSMRTTSTNKRRKRGARKGKGATDAKDETLATLADASQSLAREISRASRSSSTNRSVSIKTSGSSSRRAREPYEPICIYGLPSALLTGPLSTSRGIPPTPPVPAVSRPPATSPPPVTKKPSKWKLSFGKNSATALAPGRVSPVEEVSPPTSLDLGGAPPMSTTASNVTNLIMGLNAPSTHSVGTGSDDGSSTWSRGRRSRATNAPSNSSKGSLVLVSSRSPERSGERWAYTERRNDRAVSPNSTRSGRPIASSASSMVSSNWRSSMSTTSSAGTSTSAFTRYSNNSVRSVSTAATSVSSTSWRTNAKSTTTTNSNNSNYSNGAYTTLPKNIKIMSGVPWELDQLPRGQYANPVGDIFGAPPVRKQRTRKPKDVKLDTINERPTNSAAKNDAQRHDASTSTTDLGGLAGGKDDGDGIKKVQKGQINALAKMLSALRR
ncbi:U3 small nucleolar RNA-associated protein 6 [Hypsizygus marmoreus]|uniref:U3 small nucleolar RNA-associated protein 6 n=1 Tax=Hypsizygus marmoreus TaxID=39966 RepID=A0A369JUM5_HYPMA|nr:U3 small nucleolar RNA-associated protein 6 [Hypsizygus marmoreus]